MSGRAEPGDVIVVFRAFSKTVLADRPGKSTDKFLFQFGQLNAVLRTLRTGDARNDGGEVELEVRRIIDLPFPLRRKVGP